VKPLRLVVGACLAAFVMSVAAQGSDAQRSGASLASIIDKLPGSEGVEKTIANLTEDIPMTVAPAAYVLGVAGEQVPRFTTFREFAVALGRGIDNEGKLVNTVSAEIAPALALKALTLEDQKSWGLRALARTTFSVVAIVNADDGKASSAYGFQSVLYSRELDQAIATAGSAKCSTASQQHLDSLKNTSTLPEVPKPSAETMKGVAECQAAIDNILNLWNQTMLAVGFGQAFSSPDSTVAGLKKANQVAWLTGSWGFGMSGATRTNEDMGGLLTLHARQERDSVAETPGGATAQMPEDVDLFGASLRIGKARFNGLLEFSERTSKISGLPDEDRRRTLLGVEYRLQDDLYLSIAIGSETGRRDGRDSDFSLANLKWGFGSDSILAK
jgi:hypothetical protein